jgi:RNA polymerase sigma-70 factor (ECF subfamily)
MDVLAPDVVLLSDGGGKVRAAMRPVVTADHVARLLIGLRAKMMAGGNPPVARTEPAMVNGRPGALLYYDDVLDTVATVEIEGDRIAAVYLVRNPDKVRTAVIQRVAGR